MPSSREGLGIGFLSDCVCFAQFSSSGTARCNAPTVFLQHRIALQSFWQSLASTCCVTGCCASPSQPCNGTAAGLECFKKTHCNSKATPNPKGSPATMTGRFMAAGQRLPISTATSGFIWSAFLAQLASTHAVTVSNRATIKVLIYFFIL